jgi:sulfoxide reductase catalytic subunit YedY
MLINKPTDIPAREITARSVYLNRRTFIRAGVLAASTVATGAIYRELTRPSASAGSAPQARLEGVKAADASVGDRGFWTSETKTPRERIISYNNFYEFSTDKYGAADAAQGFATAGWKISVEGLCRKPKVFDLDDLAKVAPIEERVYRMRCVEAWSIVVPWDGFSLSKLLDQVEPTGDAKFVAFQTLLDPKRMPNQNSNVLDWPYVEGLRMDEAMHPLTILATGLYGGKLPPQDGAPVRLVIPWKYGFKGIKSIVKITLAATVPPCTWNLSAPNEYGFYANVNPEVPHPRWSQASENRLGEGRRKTLPFNGYGEQVAGLYSGMDLRVNF